MRRCRAAARSFAASLVIALVCAGAVAAQGPAQPAPQGQAAAAPAPAPASAADSFQRASQLYQHGRQLQLAGKAADAEKAFASSLSAVEKLLPADPANADLVNLQCWNLFRMNRHKDVVAAAQKVLRTAKDYRIMETMAESLFFLERSEEALQYFGNYFQLAPDKDDRMSSAYYYVGECYMRLKKYEHADIAFTTATAMEGGMYYWWYRLGVAKENLGEYKRAYEMYGKALALNSGFQYAQAARARVKAKAGL